MKRLKIKSIKVRMVLCFVLLLSVVCLGFALSSQYFAEKALVNTVNMTLPEIAEEASNAVELEIESRIDALEQMASNSIIREENVLIAEKLKMLSEEIKRSGNLNMGIAYQNGMAILDDGRKINITDRAYFKKAISGKSNVSDPIVSKDTGKHIVIYAVPIKKNGENLGVLYSVRDGNELSNITNKIKFSETGQAFMVNKEGTTIAHNNMKMVLDRENNIKNAKTDSSFKPIADITEKMIKGEKGTGTYDIKGTEKYVGFAPIKSTGWSISVIVEKEDVLKELGDLKKSSFITSLIFQALAMVVVWLIASSISKAINVNVKHVKGIANGDLTIEIPKNQLKREDELGEMAKAINIMQDSMASMIQTIKDSSDNINMQSNSVAAVSEEMASSTENVSTAIEDVAKGTGAQAEDLAGIAGILNDFGFKLEQMISTIKNIDLSTEEIKNMADGSNTDMENVINSVQNVSDAFNDLISKIRNVGQKVNRINEITNLINSISEQTNLLALNAAIEAARAGEAGRGFSVVAEEIRKLAEQSKESSENIGELIRAISNETDLMVKTTDIMKNELENQKHDIDIAITSFGEITNAVDEIRPKIQDVNTSAKDIDTSKLIILEKVEGTSAIAEEVSASSEEIAASSQEINASTEELAISAQELSNMTKNMMEQVNKFKI
ncbi:methyl-accepting chemotaxis protein [Lutibacter sp. B2]|nr:methyl-accepting chemotaxis protein [Lutibacter sp. B2]